MSTSQILHAALSLKDPAGKETFQDEIPIVFRVGVIVLCEDT